MKKFVILLGILFAWQTQTLLIAQVLEDTDPVIFNAHLLETFELTVVDGGVQEITFAIAADYNNGVVEVTGITPGITNITVEATDIWNVMIECPDFNPDNTLGNGGTGVIPIGNLGVYCVATGAHQFGAEVTCPCYPFPADIVALTNAPFELIGNGSGNAGDVSDNAFALHWEMGTPLLAVAPLGTMFDQMANGDFTVGDYTTTALLTLYSLP